eukprot:NODE_6371_length_1677_cov_9.372903.p1 GENE.NODE_6371_length_1677_cov_9.372903~~NODE_6371_length_1677_cov_9.372903.p1  ORF type:complete len:502 (+),score=169.41 NODE_6371_length_1677_cov_9.372903:127-1632(+)
MQQSSTREVAYLRVEIDRIRHDNQKLSQRSPRQQSPRDMDAVTAAVLRAQVDRIGEQEQQQQRRAALESDRDELQKSIRDELMAKDEELVALRAQLRDHEATASRQTRLITKMLEDGKALDRKREVGTDRAVVSALEAELDNVQQALERKHEEVANLQQEVLSTQSHLSDEQERGYKQEAALETVKEEAAVTETKVQLYASEVDKLTAEISVEDVTFTEVGQLRREVASAQFRVQELTRANAAYEQAQEDVRHELHACEIARAGVAQNQVQRLRSELHESTAKAVRMREHLEQKGELVWELETRLEQCNTLVNTMTSELWQSQRSLADERQHGNQNPDAVVSKYQTDLRQVEAKLAANLDERARLEKLCNEHEALLRQQRAASGEWQAQQVSTCTAPEAAANTARMLLRGIQSPPQPPPSERRTHFVQQVERVTYEQVYNDAGGAATTDRWQEAPGHAGGCGGGSGGSSGRTDRGGGRGAGIGRTVSFEKQGVALGSDEAS